MGANIVDKLTLDIDIRIEAAKKAMAKTQRDLNKVNKEIDMLQGKMQNMNNLQQGLMAAGLSFLFTGMAIKNFFQGILNNMLQTFLLVEGQTGLVNEVLNELTASFAFLQYALVDAFSQSGLMDWFVGKLIEIIDWISEWNPAVQTFVVTLMVALVVLGAILMVIGQMFLGVLGLIGLYYYGLLPAFAWILLAIGVIIALIAIWSSDMSLLKKVMWTLVIVLIVIGIIMLSMGLMIGWWILLLAGVIAIVVIFGKHLKLALLEGARAIRNFMGSAVEWLIGKFEWLINLINKIPGVSIDSETGAVDIQMGNDLDEDIKNLEAEIAADKAEKEAAKSEENGGLLGSLGNVTNVFNVEGDLVSEDDRLDKTAEGLFSKANFGNGSPQLG